jgi:ParB family chromosome partitioning protein
VRQVEALAREAVNRGAATNTNRLRARAAKNANTLALEKRISDALGLAVRIDHRERGGTLSIKYRNLDQLDEVLSRLEKKH